MAVCGGGIAKGCVITREQSIPSPWARGPWSTRGFQGRKSSTTKRGKRREIREFKAMGLSCRSCSKCIYSHWRGATRRRAAESWGRFELQCPSISFQLETAPCAWYAPNLTTTGIRLTLHSESSDSEQPDQRLGQLGDHRAARLAASRRR